MHTSADLCYVLCALRMPMRWESSSVVGSLPVSDVTVTVVRLVHRWGHSKFKTLKVRGKCEAKRAAPRLILPNALRRRSRSWEFYGSLLKRSRPGTMRSVRRLCQRWFVQLPIALAPHRPGQAHPAIDLMAAAAQRCVFADSVCSSGARAQQVCFVIANL